MHSYTSVNHINFQNDQFQNDLRSTMAPKRGVKRKNSTHVHNTFSHSVIDLLPYELWSFIPERIFVGICKKSQYLVNQHYKITNKLLEYSAHEEKQVRFPLSDRMIFLSNEALNNLFISYYSSCLTKKATFFNEISTVIANDIHFFKRESTIKLCASLFKKHMEYSFETPYSNVILSKKFRALHLKIVNKVKDSQNLNQKIMYNFLLNLNGEKKHLKDYREIEIGERKVLNSLVDFSSYYDELKELRGRNYHTGEDFERIIEIEKYISDEDIINTANAHYRNLNFKKSSEYFIMYFDRAINKNLNFGRVRYILVLAAETCFKAENFKKAAKYYLILKEYPILGVRFPLINALIALYHEEEFEEVIKFFLLFLPYKDQEGFNMAPSASIIIAESYEKIGSGIEASKHYILALEKLGDEASISVLSKGVDFFKRINDAIKAAHYRNQISKKIKDNSSLEELKMALTVCQSTNDTVENISNLESRILKLQNNT